jgi:sec-independent protein translocase protein TatC
MTETTAPPIDAPGDDDAEGERDLRKMSFLEHLEELRQRLVRSAISVFVGFVICFYFSDHIYGLLAKPLTDTLQGLHMADKLVYTNPVDPFNLYIKLSIVGGIFLAAPYILFQLWLFISPGLYRHEKKYVWPFVGLTSSLFFAGGFFAYRFAFPAALKFLLEFGHRFTPMITIHEYWSLALTIILGVGVVFELPVVILLLSIFGIVTPKFLVKNIRYAVIITAVVAAALAPTPDWTTLFMFWMPLVALYIISIGLSWLVQYRKNRKRRHEQA